MAFLIRGHAGMSQIVSSIVEIAVFRFRSDQPEYLLMKRSGDERVYPNLWQFVSGKIKPGEKATDAALRELREETGFTPIHFWVVPFINTFYEPGADAIVLSPSFAGQVGPAADPTLSAEHDQFEWLMEEPALRRLVWPGQRRLLETIHRSILGGEESGLLTLVNR